MKAHKFNGKRGRYFDDRAIDEIMADGRNRRRQRTERISRLWLWLGISILLFILIYWMFTVGIWSDMIAYLNG
jgi:hypothetical protein